MRVQFLAMMCITWIAMSYGPICLAEAGEKMDNGTHNFTDVPQEIVVCTGWHALCTASHDCIMHGGKADCCQWRRKIVQLWRYKIDHLVQKLSPKYHVHYSLT
jgi:hypothetical protein